MLGFSSISSAPISSLSGFNTIAALDSATIIVSGQDLQGNFAYNCICESGEIVLNGNDTIKNIVSLLSPATISVSGNPLYQNLQCNLSGENYSLVDRNISVDLLISTNQVNLALSVKDSSISLNVSAEAFNMTSVGQLAIVAKNILLQTESGLYDFNLGNINPIKDLNIHCDSKTFNSIFDYTSLIK